MTVKGVKLKSESSFLISPGVLELWRKNLRGVDFGPPDMDRVKVVVRVGSYPEIFAKLWENVTCHLL